VISTRDVTFDESQRYDPQDADPPKPDRFLIEAIVSPSIPELTEDEDSEPVFEIESSEPRRVDTETIEPSGVNPQIDKGMDVPSDTIVVEGGLITPDPTPEPDPTGISEGVVGTGAQLQENQTGDSITLTLPPLYRHQTTTHMAIGDSGDQNTLTANQLLPSQSGTTREIKGNVSTDNIIIGKRDRAPKRQAYAVNLESLDQWSSFHASFATSLSYKKARIHRTQLPAPPRFWKEMISHPQRAGFEAAAGKEYKELQNRGTFKTVPRPKAKGSILPVMWVFTYKFDTDGFLLKHKARLVVRGDMQIRSEKDTYAATLASTIFRALMAIAVYFGLDIWQFDAINAFLNALIDEEVYIRFPEGFEGADNECSLLLRALYGLSLSRVRWFC
jgi:hypothetical protein